VWTPIRVDWTGSRPRLDWCHTAGVAFTDPFFDQTVERALRRPFNLVFRQLTDIEVLGDLPPGREPAGIIAHLSRSGSTLVAQMLAAVTTNRVMSEAGPIASMLQAGEWTKIAPAEHLEWVRAIVSALGPADPHSVHYIVKLDVWSAASLALIRRAFPDVPWVFLYRDPVEIMVSQLERRAPHLIPGRIPPEVLGLAPAEAASLGPEEYCARVLAHVAAVVLDHVDDPTCQLVRYDQLPDAVLTRILPFFGIETTPADRDAMIAATRRDAKSPTVAFVPDTASKQARASSEVIRQTRRWLSPLDDRLEQARRAQRRS
jgi:hypothetical protein